MTALADRWEAVVCCSPLGGTHRAILGVLAFRADPNSLECSPSLDTLARECGFSRSTVLRGLADLEALGLIYVTRRRTGAGALDCNRYRVDMDAIRAFPGRPVPLTPRAVRWAAPHLLRVPTGSLPRAAAWLDRNRAAVEALDARHQGAYAPMLVDLTPWTSDPALVLLLLDVRTVAGRIRRGEPAGPRADDSPRESWPAARRYAHALLVEPLTWDALNASGEDWWSRPPVVAAVARAFHLAGVGPVGIGSGGRRDLEALPAAWRRWNLGAWNPSTDPPCEPDRALAALVRRWSAVAPGWTWGPGNHAPAELAGRADARAVIAAWGAYLEDLDARGAAFPSDWYLAIRDWIPMYRPRPVPVDPA